MALSADRPLYSNRLGNPTFTREAAGSRLPPCRIDHYELLFINVAHPGSAFADLA